RPPPLRPASARGGRIHLGGVGAGSRRSHEGGASRGVRYQGGHQGWCPQRVQDQGSEKASGLENDDLPRLDERHLSILSPTWSRAARAGKKRPIPAEIDAQSPAYPRLVML